MHSNKYNFSYIDLSFLEKNCFHQMDAMKKVKTSNQIKNKIKRVPAIKSNYIPDNQVALYIKCLCVKKNL